MDQNGYLCLSDFVSDKLIQRKKKAKKSLVGNILYMAPEKIFKKYKFEGMKGKEGDWYSLGVIL